MRIAAAVGLALAVSSSASVAIPCAVAPPPGEEARVAAEEAIIVWDEKTRTEQFIRRATFQSTSARLGFLVPTPTKPALSEVDQRVFEDAARAIAPRYETVTEGYSVVWSILWGMTRSASAPTAVASAMPEGQPVRVLERTNVAGMDAAILEADSATALAEWLETNGFHQTPTISEWLTPYVAAKWKITAFKYGTGDAGAQPGMFGASAVKLTFETERPFYPYREPVNARAALPAKLRDLPQAEPRLLRLYFIGNQRMEGSVGGTPWKADTLYGAPPQTTYASAETPLPMGEGTIVTAFHDRQDPRPGVDELWFRPAADQSKLEQPPILIKRPQMILLPMELLIPAFGISLTVWLVWRGRRARKEAAEEARRAS